MSEVYLVPFLLPASNLAMLVAFLCGLDADLSTKGHHPHINLGCTQQLTFAIRLQPLDGSEQTCLFDSRLYAR